MNNEKLYKLKEDVVYKTNDKGMMIYVPEEGMVHMINSTAGNIITLLEKNNLSFDQILNKFAEEFPDVDKKILKEDIDEFIDSLLKIEVIKCV